MPHCSLKHRATSINWTLLSAKLPEFLAMVLQPVMALLLLFLLGDEVPGSRREPAECGHPAIHFQFLSLCCAKRPMPLQQVEGASTSGEAALSAESGNQKPFFLKQTIRNACGTIGLIHAIANPAQPLQPGQPPWPALCKPCKQG